MRKIFDEGIFSDDQQLLSFMVGSRPAKHANILYTGNSDEEQELLSQTLLESQHCQPWCDTKQITGSLSPGSPW